MKYRYLVVHDGIVEADTEAQAEALALWEADNGLSQATGVQVEALGKESGEDG